MVVAVWEAVAAVTAAAVVATAAEERVAVAAAVAGLAPVVLRWEIRRPRRSFFVLPRLACTSRSCVRRVPLFARTASAEASAAGWAWAAAPARVAVRAAAGGAPARLPPTDKYAARAYETMKSERRSPTQRNSEKALKSMKTNDKHKVPS